jgi:hypothetical protein
MNENNNNNKKTDSSSTSIQTYNTSTTKLYGGHWHTFVFIIFENKLPFTLPPTVNE